MLNKNTDRELADARAKEIILNVNSKNVYGLKNLFSNKIIQESENIDEGCEKLFDFIGGEIISYESHVGTGTQDYYEYV